MPFAKGGFDFVEHVMDLFFGNDQRRAEGDRVAKGAQDHTVFHAFLRNGLAGRTRRRDCGFQAFVIDKFKCT